LEVDAAIQQLKEDEMADKEYSRREFRELRVDLKELRHMIVDAPTIECENGIADTEAIVRAIQRDGRRLDNFNEIIMTVRDEHNSMRALFGSLNAAVERIQLNIVDFVNDSNRTKTELINFSKETRQSTKETSRKVMKCSADVGFVIDATITGMNLISNTFLQIFSFLSKITTRPLPIFGSFDDSLLEFQRLSDATSAQNEKYDDEQKTRDLSPPRDLDLDPTFQLPSVEIGPAGFSAPRAPIQATERTTGEFLSCVDAEMRQTLVALESKLDRSLSELSEFQGALEQRLSQKADFVTVERIMEKVRGTLQQLREKQRQVQNALVFCIQRDEAEALVHHILTHTSAAGETAASSRNLECLLCGRARSAVSGNRLPMLSTTPTAHSVIYGRQFTPDSRTSMSQKSTRRSLDGSRPHTQKGLVGPSAADPLLD
jgi:hypothetical protein